MVTLFVTKREDIMTKKTLNEYIAIYKEHLAKGDIQAAYTKLTKYVMQLKTEFEKEFSDKFTFGNVMQGYMDFTYFYFFNAELREQKLRYGIVLNHEKIQFELWLMGINAKAQNEYWAKLKDSKWNSHRTEMSRYSVLEVVLVANPDFDNLEILGLDIRKKVMEAVEEIGKVI